jgi:hypothetical protein
VGNKQDAELKLLLEIEEKVQDRGLHGYVERGGNFVADQNTGAKGKRARDAQALSLTAAKFARIAVEMCCQKTDRFEQPYRLVPSSVRRCQSERFQERFTNPHHGVQGRIWILKNHLDRPPWDFLQILALVAQNSVGGFQHPRNHLSEGGFAAAGFPHNAEGFAGEQFETYAIKGAYRLLF